MTPDTQASADPSSEPSRVAQRLEFARAATADPSIVLERASEDASFRSYWRTHGAGESRIVMDAPPQHEALDAWLDIDARLRAAGLHAPRVFAREDAQGFLLIEDLGTRTYLPELNEASADALYADALDALATMQARVAVDGLPPYDEPFLATELELMPTWFLQRHLGIDIECDEWDVIEAAFRLLVNSALSQPRCFVHRDYHSRNLLAIDGDDRVDDASRRSPGIIDFQGAMHGPIAYDVASLLRDCYIEWDDARVDAWSGAHRLRLRDDGVLDARVDADTWRRWFDLIGLQRHLKVLGIFCRLWYRDGKRGYLNDLPRVWRYVRGAASRYPEFAEFVALMESKIGARDVTQPT
ncbi:MAG: phosphotransferase [Proteobacteria bacterium]|nr:phosphotransferase [Pseudomonadota bacterium]